MLFKLSIKILFVTIEVFLAFYSLAISDSLLVKFIFFALTAVAIAFIITRIINKLLPIDKDYISSELEEEEEEETSRYSREKISFSKDNNPED